MCEATGRHAMSKWEEGLPATSTRNQAQSGVMMQLSTEFAPGLWVAQVGVGIMWRCAEGRGGGRGRGLEGICRGAR